MAVDEVVNVDRQLIDSFVFTFSYLFIMADRYSICITADTAPIHLSYSCSLLSLWYLNFTWGSNLVQAWRVYATFCLRSDLEAVATSHSPANHQCKLEGITRWSQKNITSCAKRRGKFLREAGLSAGVSLSNHVGQWQRNVEDRDWV